ncbi:serine/threonine-protein kinase [Gloeobacter morelensis]|uniref:Serine/threonine protein kinase n=1 Tax=Gloeobacter morelensis MG652769 TaxID=2781736 RepID=A0ABY3PHV3_9CYAN|nr:serine/threonine-protein kinase [Gloeobacter morelensis]UFP93235.1 serine/threonine protein kinase [Gloeobacter morelensis MG652769]
MNTFERWQRVGALFDRAVELDPAERSCFFANLNAEDAGLRAEVESLLAWHEQDTDFLEAPAFSVVGSRLGAYRVLREIGRGGMSVVYLAGRADAQFRKQVAIKLLKPGWESAHLVERFQLERQLLANLEHPNIARLIDGGATREGRPYLVMEYVDGVPIDEYCRRQRLSLPERLKLFCRVGAAVQYAHQNLIVHRDIKPGNILVTAEGEPKLLDFGIAKLLDAAPGVPLPQPTATVTRMLTPTHASPEQLRGGPITTASDVYSLGVLLYELLTARSPYQVCSEDPQAFWQAVCHEEPQKPSSTAAEPPSGTAAPWRRALRGDLDNIVLMALRKEPARRYGSVDQLVRDIERHLEGLPVAAREDTWRYRTSKFIGRNKAAVTGAVLVVLSLVGGMAAAGWQARSAQIQRDLAVRAANSMVHEMAGGLGQMLGPTQSRLGLLVRAGEIFDEVNVQGGTTAELQRQSAEANRVLSQAYRQLGDYRRASKRATLAVRQARALAGDAGSTPQGKAVLAAALMELGDVLRDTGQAEQAERLYGQARPFAEAAAGAAGAPATHRRNLANLLQRQGDIFYNGGKLAEAETLYLRSAGIYQDSLARGEGTAEAYSVHAIGLERLADMHYAAGQVDRGCERYREALQMHRRARAGAAGHPLLLQRQAIGLQNAGWCAEQQGQQKAALELYREGVQLQRQLLAADPANIGVRQHLMGGLGTIGALHTVRGETALAVSQYREALAFGKTLQQQKIDNAEVNTLCAELAWMLALALIKQGKTAEAEVSLV